MSTIEKKKDERSDIFYMFGIDVKWDAVSAIGTCLGSFATFVTVIIALYPYIKRGKLYFTKYSNIEQGPVLTIINGRAESMHIEKIVFYAGPILFNKYFFEDGFMEFEDDLVSDKTTNHVEPYASKKIPYNTTRIIHFMQHSGIRVRCLSYFNVRIVVFTHNKRIVLNTRTKTKEFVDNLIMNSPAYSHVKPEDIL